VVGKQLSTIRDEYPTGKVAPFDEASERVIDDIARHIEDVSDDTASKALRTLADQIRDADT